MSPSSINSSSQFPVGRLRIRRRVTKGQFLNADHRPWSQEQRAGEALVLDRASKYISRRVRTFCHDLIASFVFDPLPYYNIFHLSFS